MNAILSNRLVVFAVLAIIVIIAVVYLLPNSQTPETTDQPILLNSMQAAILRPADGSQLSDNAPITLSAQASSPDQIVSLELWIDGVLASVHYEQAVFTNVALGKVTRKYGGLIAPDLICLSSRRKPIMMGRMPNFPFSLKWKPYDLKVPAFRPINIRN